MPTPLVPAQALWPEGYPYSWVSALSSSLLSVPGEGLQRGDWDMGASVPSGPRGGASGEGEKLPGPWSHQELSGCPPACEGGGDTQFISINTYDVPVTFLSAPAGGLGWAPNAGGHSPVPGCCTVKCSEWTAVAAVTLGTHWTMSWAGIRCPERVTCWSQGLQSVCVYTWGSIIDLLIHLTNMYWAPVTCQALKWDLQSLCFIRWCNNTASSTKNPCLKKTWNLNLMKPLRLTMNLLEIRETEEHVKQYQREAISQVQRQDVHQASWPGFSRTQRAWRKKNKLDQNLD